MDNTFQKKNLIVWIVIYLVIMAFTISACDWFDFQKPKKETLAHRKVSIATFKGLFSGPIFIAHVKGYFKKEGLDVTIEPYMSGKAALNAILDGKTDLATVAETPIVHACLNEENVYVLATFVTSHKNLALIARKKDIAKFSDLKGKRIGVTLGTNGEFFLDNVLILFGIKRAWVDVVDIKPDDMFDALLGRRVDAVSTWNPHVLRLRKELGNKGIVSYGEKLYEGTFNLTSTKEFVNNNNDVIISFIRALIQAEKFIGENPAEAKRIIVDYTNLDINSVKELWDSYNFRVTLKRSFLITLEDEALWAIKNNLTKKKKIPHFIDYIYLDAIQVVRPESTDIIF